MARTTKTPSYAPDIPERKTIRKTASSAKKSPTAKKAEAAQLEIEETKASTTDRAAAAKKKQSRPAKKAERAPQKPIMSEYVEQKPEFIALKQLQIPFYERYLLTVEETSAYCQGSHPMCADIPSAARWLVWASIPRAFSISWGTQRLRSPWTPIHICSLKMPWRTI